MSFDSRIAVIGMSGRFPGAATLDQYWSNLCKGVDAISRSTVVRNGQRKVRALGMLRDVDLFDATFFNFTAKEAEITDPQHRIFLEVAWESLENAGYGAENYRGSVGIFAGASGSRYGQMLYANPALMNYLGEIYAYLGNEKDFLATRVSYKLNLSGPSVVVQTACSTALVATHLACQSLLNGECDLAMAGGVSLMRATKNNPEAESTVEEISTGSAPNDGGVISPEGYCRAFDANASGTIAGEAAGVIVLKRLSEAQKDGDFIHAIIRGSAMNNDGARKFGFTAPSVEGQASVITEALTLSGVPAETIHYVEAHGTGTPLGDPVEVAALSQVFQKRTEKKHFCAIGSVKTNIGHTDAAAGVAGLIKSVLSLKHGLIPPSLHYEKPNPEIDFENSPFFVNQVLRDWPRNGSPRRAGVSSFGIGGTNVHLILEEAPEREVPGTSRAQSLFVLSAKTPSALESATANLAQHLENHPELDPADAAYTLQVGRKEFAYRRIVVAEKREELILALKNPNSQGVLTAEFSATSRPITFLFPGSAGACVNVGRALYDHEPAFREAVDLTCHVAQSRFGIDLHGKLYPDEKESGEIPQPFKPEISEFRLFAIEYALARLWISWGVFPDFVAGDSTGEYVAACVADVVSVSDALELIAAKVRHKSSSNDEAWPDASSRAPDQHSIRKIKFNKPKIPCFSTLTSDWITGPEAVDPDHWLKHLQTETPIADSLQVLLVDPEAILLEVGPGQAIASLIKSHAALHASQLVLSSLADAPIQSRELLRVAGQLWLNGTPLDWVQFHAGERRYRTPLPAYPFERQSYWLDFERTLQPAVAPEPMEAAGRSAENAAPAPEEGPDSWFYLPSWKRSLVPDAQRQQDKSCWLTFIEPSTLGEKAAICLEQEGSRVIRVSRGAQFVRHGENSYSINPRQSGDYAELLQQIAISEHTAIKVLHGWSLAPEPPEGSPLERFEHAQYLSSYSLLRTVQAFGKQWPGRRLRIEVLSQGVQVVAEAQSAGPEKAVLSGAMKVIAKEHPNVHCRNVDIDGTDSHEKTIQLVLQEIKAEPGDSVVALRGSRRFVGGFEKIKVPAPAGIPRLARTAGVYLITSVLGEAGLSFARYLAKTVGPKLAFLVPPGFPEKKRWNLWKATSDPNTHVSRAITCLQEIERLGAEVLVQQAEAGDPDQLKKAVAVAREHFGALHGVVHEPQLGQRRAFRMIRDIDGIFYSQQLQERAKELLMLEAALEKRPLDLVLLLAPLAPLFGEVGRCADAAAANFFQAYALQRDSAGPVRWIAVNFDSPLLREREAGSVAATGEEDPVIAATNEIWARIVSGSMGAQIVVSKKELRPDLKASPAQAQAVQSSTLLPVDTVQIETTVSGGTKIQAEATVESASQPARTVPMEDAGAATIANIQNGAKSTSVAGPQAQEPQPQVKAPIAPSVHAGKGSAGSSSHHPGPVPLPVQQKKQKPQAAPGGESNGDDPAAATIPQGVVLPPLHPRPNLSVPFVAPATEAQKSIALIWQELLRLKEVGIRDDFFQLGGDSLVATQMMSRLRTHFQLELPLRYFFEYPTIESMEKAIQNAKENGVSAQRPAISRVARNERGKTLAAAETARSTPEIIQGASSNGRA